MNIEKATQIAYLLLRIAAGVMFMQGGGTKIFDWFGGIPAEFGGHPAAWSQSWIGGVLEFYGGALIVIGLFTRPVAFILSGMMAVAFWQFHFKQEAPWPAQNGGAPAVLYCFIFLFMAAFGGGKWSLDALMRRKRSGDTGAAR